MGHSCRKLLWDTLVGRSCRTLLWVTLVGNSCGTLLWDTLPAFEILRVLKLYSSQLPAPKIAPRTKVVLQSRQFSASSSTGCSAYLVTKVRQILRVLKLHYKVTSARLHFARSTRTISAQGCAGTGQIALSPAFRALDTHDLRRGWCGHQITRTLACISRAFARSTDTISAEGCALMGQIALSPAFRTFTTHDLRRRLRVKSPKRAFRTRLPQKLTRQSLRNERFVRDFLQKSSGNHRSTHITQPCQAVSRVQPLQTTSAHTPIPM